MHYKKTISTVLIFYLLEMYNLNTLIFYLFYKQDCALLYLILFELKNYFYIKEYDPYDFNSLIDLYSFDISLMRIVRFLFSLLVLFNFNFNRNYLRNKNNERNRNNERKWIILIIVNNFQSTFLYLILHENYLLFLLMIRNLLIKKFYLLHDTNLNFVGWTDVLISFLLIYQKKC